MARTPRLLVLAAFSVAAVVTASCAGPGPAPIVPSGTPPSTSPPPPPAPPPPPPPPPPSGPRSTGPIAFVSNRDGADHIYLANEDGSAVTRLVAGWRPAWSRDGRQIAFEAGAIFVINVDGSGLRQIVDGFSPAWSPDGRVLAFSPDYVAIAAVDANGGNHRVLRTNSNGISGIAWSPDGLTIAFSEGTYSEPGASGIWLMSPDGSNPRELSAHWDAWWPAWAPGGDEIALVTHSGLRIITPDGGVRRAIGGIFGGVDYTPEGHLIYAKAVSNSWSGPARIFIRADGLERQLIPEATAPVVAGYRDYNVVYLR
jgi:hypothetical protein